MTVPDVMRILGLGKTAAYRLINQCRFKTYLVFGKMRVDVDSFEEWYAGQFHYKKINGERPGKKYGKTISPLTVAKVLGIPRSTANDLMNNGIVEFIWVENKRHIIQEKFLLRTEAVVTLLIRSFRGGQVIIAHYLYVLSYYIIAVTGGGCFERTEISFISFR